MKKLLLAFLAFCALNIRAELPPLIPREVLFGNPERLHPEISPDGKQLAWLAADKSGVLNVWVSAIDGSNARTVTNETHRPVPWYKWSGDGKHILYLQDNDGNEIDHLFSANLENKSARDLTPFPGVRAQNVLTDPQKPRFVLVALNKRDPHAFDMHRIDLETGAITLEAKNPGDVLTWKTDHDFVVRAATAFEGKTLRSIIRVRDAIDKPWRDLVVMPFERALFAGEVVGGSLIAGFAPNGKSLLIHSALHSDKGRLVRVDLQNGDELGVVAQDPTCDVAEEGLGDEPSVIINPVTHVLEAVKFEHATSRWIFLEPELEADFEKIGRDASGFVDLISRDRADRNWIVSAQRSDTPDAYFVFNRDTKKITSLFKEVSALSRFVLAKKKSVVIKSRDSLDLVSYLTIPAGVEPKNLPLVLLVHGGPWFRDHDNYDAEVQFLANRGYAVLQVNYRGSTGFGIDFFNAGTHEWGLGMQEDLYDAVQWAIDQKIADPKRIASMGWSGGGFATLRGLEMRPDLFACGVDGVGPGDVATLFRSFPSYWSNITARWRRRAGDADHDPEWNRKISAPLSCRCDSRASAHRAGKKRSARDDRKYGRNGRCAPQSETRSDLHRLSRRRPRLCPSRK